MLLENETMEIELENGETAQVKFYSDGMEKITAHLVFEDEEDEGDKEEKNDDPDNEIGSIEVENTESDIYLSQIDVDKEYRGLGIGKKLVLLAINHLSLSKIACVTESEAYRFSLTPPGEALIASCARHGIISGDMCVFSNETSEILDEDADDGDPGYDSVSVGQALERVRKGEAKRAFEKPIVADPDFSKYSSSDKSPKDDDSDNDNRYQSPAYVK